MYQNIMDTCSHWEITPMVAFGSRD